MTKSRNILAPRQLWTPEQIEQLSARYPHEKTESIAADMGRALGLVFQKAARLGLKKSAEYLASPAACRLRRGDNVGKEYRFKSGQVVWNKGMKGLQYESQKATQFKPGQSPSNTRAIGSYRLDKDGTLQRKTSNDKGNNSQRWRGVHELVWIEAHGPRPPKHIVVFKPGMRTAELNEITVDRVECISLADNMRRNTIHQYPDPLKDVIRLSAKLRRKLNGN